LKQSCARSLEGEEDNKTYIAKPEFFNYISEPEVFPVNP
jgi:hypothetical protein